MGERNEHLERALAYARTLQGDIHTIGGDVSVKVTRLRVGIVNHTLKALAKELELYVEDVEAAQEAVASRTANEQAALAEIPEEHTSPAPAAGSVTKPGPAV